jgi:LPS export ABC transporter protein LptC
MKVCLLKNVKILVLSCFSIVLIACETIPVKIPEPYTGPVSVITDLDGIVTQAAIEAYRIKSAHMAELQSGDRVFKKGVYLETFDENETVESTLKSDSAYFIKKTQVWILTYNVELKNIQSKEELLTDELFWEMEATDSTNVYVKPKTFVEVKTSEQVFTGYGLRTTQDFKTYEILNLEGVFDVDEE